MSKIAKVEAFPIAYREPHYKGTQRWVTFARVESDDGAVGWGEAISQIREATLATRVLVLEGFGPLIHGADPTEVEVLWHKMCRHAWWYGVEGIAAFAISAIDMALWDLKGKLLGKPVANLIGGQLRTEIPAMGSVIFDMDDLDWTLDEFRFMQEQGYRILKAGWGMSPDSMFGGDRARDLRYLTAIRETIGDEPALVVDVPGAHLRWDGPTAIQRLREWEQFDLRWVEQPLNPADLDLHRRVRAAVAVPIGTGEDEWSPETYKRVIDADGVDVLQLDPGRCLGLSGCRDIVKLVEAAQLRCSAHTWSSALNTAASLAFLASSPNADTLDFKPHHTVLQNELFEDPWVPEDGMLRLRDKPGLGVTVSEEALEHYVGV